MRNNTTKYYFGEKSSFLHTLLKFFVNRGKSKLKNNLLSKLEVNFNIWQNCPVVNCFKYQVYMCGSEAMTYEWLQTAEPAL